MKTVTFVLIFLTVFAVNVKQACSLIMENMDTNKDRIELDSPSSSTGSSGILKSHSGLFGYKSGRNKTLILSAPQGYSIFAAVRLLDLRPNEQDTLTLFANKTSGPVRYTNYYAYQNRVFDPDETLKTFYAPDGQLGVTFSTGSGTTLVYQGFELLFTVQANFSKCNFEDFRCSNGRCISRVYKCDGHNHCGDRSDQWNCGSFPKPIRRPSTARVVGVVAGVLFLLIAVICAIYIMIRRAQRLKTVTRTVVNQHPPPPNVQEYPPPYPEPGMTYPPPPPPYSPYQGISNPGYK